MLVSVKRFWKFIRILYLERMRYRTEGGEKLGVYSRRGWGANLMFAGLICCMIGLIWFTLRAHFELNALTASSEVLEVRPDTSGDGKAVYELTLKWTDQNGVDHVTVPRVRASFYNVPVGTELAIKYDPNNPADVRVETQEGPWYFPSLIIIGSVISFLVGRLVRGNPQDP